MEHQDIPQVKRRKHKTDFFVFSKAQGRVIKPKRLSCMKASEYLLMEESKISVADHCIEEILFNVFDSINKAKITSELCLKQVEKKVQLVQYFDYYNLENIEQENVTFINLEQQPKTQPKHKVIFNKQKISQSEHIDNKKEIAGNQLNKNSICNSKSHLKLPNKEKLSNPGHFASIRSSRSMQSIKSGRGNSFMVLELKNNQSIIQEDSQKQKQKQKQKKRKQEIIKKLLKQHQQKLKQITHLTPEPILQQYRAFFTQPETRQQEDLRTSFLYLKQLRQSQQNLNRKKVSKRGLNKSFLSQSESKQNLSNRVKLPNISKPSDINKYKNSVSLFAQDQNGSVIKVKNSQRLDTFTRQSSLTMHENMSKKPQLTKFIEVSSIFKHTAETLNNPKIKGESQFINENSSMVSTLCQSMDEDLLQKSLLQSFSQKNGVTLKKSMYYHQASMSTNLQSVKLPSILMKKTQIS